MKTKETISKWLVDYVARILDVEPSMIDPQVSLGDYGLDSAGAVGLSSDLSEWLGTVLAESVAFDHPTILQLSEHAAGLQARQEADHG